LSDLHRNYKNISGTHIIINDLGWEIPVDGILDTEALPPEALARSRDLRRAVAKSIIIPWGVPDAPIRAFSLQPEPPDVKAIAREVATEVVAGLRDAGMMGGMDPEAIREMIERAGNRGGSMAAHEQASSTAPSLGGETGPKVSEREAFERAAGTRMAEAIDEHVKEVGESAVPSVEAEDDHEDTGDITDLLRQVLGDHPGGE
jgi:hypothetical protein